MRNVFGSDVSKDSFEGFVSVGLEQVIKIVSQTRQMLPKQLPPNEFVSHFDEIIGFDNTCKELLGKYWCDIRARIMKTPIDSFLSLHDIVFDGL